MRVCVVIPNWNGRKKLEKNLPTVLKAKHIDEIVIVDDASSDDSVTFLKEKFPSVKLIEKKKNSGFSSTVNLGVKSANGDLVFLLNSDAAPETNCLDFVLPHFENPRVFSVGCNVGGAWAWANFKNGYLWHRQMEPSKVAHQTLWVSGGSGVFRKKVWEDLGGLDELFDPFYEEDTDLGYRATKRGFVNIFEPKARVEHYKDKGVIEENFSKTHVARVAQRNQLLMIWKNISSPDLLRQHYIGLLKQLVTHPGYLRVFIPALMRLPGILEKRKKELQNQVLTDEEIFGKFC